jgi:hypothetical protein
MKTLIGALIGFLAAAGAAQAEQPARYLPLTRTQVISLTAGSMNTDSLDIKKVDAKKTHPGENFAPDDELTIANNPKIPFCIVLAGQGENIHSIRIVAPVVNYSKEQGDRVFKILSSIFVKIYPSWPDAGNWPTDSAGKAWNSSPLVTHKMSADADDQIIRKEIGGVTSATFGVPPDVVVYSITTRAQCIPTTKTGNPFQRAAC